MVIRGTRREGLEQVMRTEVVRLICAGLLLLLILLMLAQDD